jgi:hypothetical protein
MESLPNALIVSSHAMREVYSALPNSPVVPYVERARRTWRVRATLAGALARAARVVAPPEGSPAR